MRPLVISAFVVTLLLSAFTVFLALRSDSLDGEPHALISIEPPKVALQTKQVKTQNVVSIPAPEPVASAAQTRSPSRTPEVTQSPEPKLTPVTTQSDTSTITSDDVEASARNASESITETTSLATRRPTETAQPIATKPAPAEDDPFFSAAEPGLGLGVGNLGPLPTVPSSN